MSDDYDLDNYKIQEIVGDNFDSYPVNDIDYTVHLQPEISLDKTTSRRLSDFRPEYKHAYLEVDGVDVVYARQRFAFEIAESGLMTSRTIYQAYYLNDGTLGKEFQIKYKSWNHERPSDLGEVVAEQAKLRVDVANYIKSLVLKAVIGMNPNFDTEDAITEASKFFLAYDSQRVAFIEIGSKAYRDAIAEINISQSQFGYLQIPMALLDNELGFPESSNLRDAIVSLT